MTTSGAVTFIHTESLRVLNHTLLPFLQLLKAFEQISEKMDLAGVELSGSKQETVVTCEIKAVICLLLNDLDM